VGSSQREATFVAIGLVIVATLVLVYMFNEPHRRDVAAEEKVQDSIDRGAAMFVQFCVPCHGPDGKAEGRIGIPLNTEQNQTTDPVLGAQRDVVIHNTIQRGRTGTAMPAWGQTDGGPLNEQQITDLVTLIRQGGWDEVYHLAVEASGGVPTPPATATPQSPAEEGKALFGQVCVNCHKSIDYPNGGVVGPDLSNLATHDTSPQVGVPVTVDGLTAWINNPQAIKPGTIMPPKGGATTWGDAEVSAVVQYLLSLK
jgi:mono/diheme cytochrome c family protein